MVVSSHTRSFVLFLAITLLSASTLAPASPIVTLDPIFFDLIPRDFRVNNASGTPEIVDSNTRQIVLQGPATDGSGTGFDLSAILWIVFSTFIGLPMALAGFRGWRLTISAGYGLMLAAGAWGAFINAVSGNGIPDSILTAVILVFFFFGCCLGPFEFARQAGIAIIGFTGGSAFGMRVMIIKDNLLISSREIGGIGADLYKVSWSIVGLCGVANALWILWMQRAGIAFGCASSGTFLTSLAVDLAINQQHGMSRGLRFLFDRNSAHLADLFVKGYKPPISTQIILGISLGLTPVLAFAQARMFKEPFSRNKLSDWEARKDEEKIAPVAVNVTRAKQVRRSGRLRGIITSPAPWGPESRFSV
ncbi:hypothetical protein BDN72DRAFT_759285 [Pluteus cervinus]|uniref:Uncharacterized protein n=1 Tax=Pluteus cervinus TaxID=181527 RepID=A0ACD3B8R3_9AGAR|nr:hypothetical protein BDN72DRAFT_759285 [Pluteus cervinus]